MNRAINVKKSNILSAFNALTIIGLFLIAISFSSCRNYLLFSNAKGGFLEVEANTIDSNAYNALSPYREKLSGILDKVVVWSTGYYEKRKPESELGNLMADAMLNQARNNYNTPVHGAILNYGGIRGAIYPNEVTIGHIFELMPFDNEIVIMELNGIGLQQLCDRWAEAGGTPIAGFQFIISNKKATNITINNEPLNPTKTYAIAMTDYMANGGDDCGFLTDVGLKRIDLGIIYRDALIDDFTQKKHQGIMLDPQLDGRISVQ